MVEVKRKIFKKLNFLLYFVEDNCTLKQGKEVQNDKTIDQGSNKYNLNTCMYVTIYRRMERECYI